MKRLKIAKTPWKISYKQVTQGKNGGLILARPVIEDADGKKVNFRRKGNALVASLAPAMLAVLEGIEGAWSIAEIHQSVEHILLKVRLEGNQ